VGLGQRRKLVRKELHLAKGKGARHGDGLYAARPGTTARSGWPINLG
jgi:hypothetical protein